MQSIVIADVHGNLRLYELALRIAETWRISSVFIAGDLAPSSVYRTPDHPQAADDAVAVQRRFFRDEWFPLLESFFLRRRHTHVYAIMGNDDRRANEALLLEFDDATPNFHLVNDRLVELHDAKQMRSFFADETPLLHVCGYPYVPPGGGLVMDWVKYDNRARLRPPGMDPCADIYQMGITTTEYVPETTIEDDLCDFGVYLARCEPGSSLEYDPTRTIHLFHAPPYDTALDWAAPRGKYEHLRLPDHVGSNEVRRFIGRTTPYLFLSGHCHESVVFGNYRTFLGETPCVNPGSEAHASVLSVVQFDVFHPSGEMKQFFIRAD